MSTGNAGRTLAVAVMVLLATSAWAQQGAAADLLMQKMVDVVLSHNPVLASQQRLVDEAQKIPDRSPGFTIPGLTLSSGLYTWNPYTDVFALLPSVTVGLSLSFNDPARELNILRVKEEKEMARQNLVTAKNAALADLFSKIRDILKLKSQGKNLAGLRDYLRDSSTLAESQRSAQSVSPDKLWDLRQRITDIETQLDTLDGQVQTTMMEAAMSLGGDAWQELLGLFRQLGA